MRSGGRGPRVELVGVDRAAVFIAGIEALRGQTRREFPHETWETLRERWAQGRSRRRDPTAPAPPAQSAESGRLGDLERLVAMRDSGALDPEEFEVEKKRLLA